MLANLIFRKSILMMIMAYFKDLYLTFEYKYSFNILLLYVVNMANKSNANITLTFNIHINSYNLLFVYHK